VTLRQMALDLSAWSEVRCTQEAGSGQVALWLVLASNLFYSQGMTLALWMLSSGRDTALSEKCHALRVFTKPYVLSRREVVENRAAVPTVLAVHKTTDLCPFVVRALRRESVLGKTIARVAVVIDAVLLLQFFNKA
jgi:hypothetical protein